MGKQYQKTSVPSLWIPILVTTAITLIVILTLLPTIIFSFITTAESSQTTKNLHQVLLAIQLFPAILMLLISVITFRKKEGFDWDADLKKFTKFQAAVWAISGFMVVLVEIIVAIFTAGLAVQGNARFSFILLSGLGLLSTAWSATVFSEASPTIVLAVFAIWASAILIFTIRGILGILRLLPISWRS